MFILFLIIGNSLIASYLRTNFLEVVWVADDGINLSVAENFRKTGKFFFDTTSYHNPQFSVDKLIERYPNAEYPMVVKGPLYYIGLGGFLELINPPLEELWVTGSYFNNILSSFFLVLFFFLLKKKFGLFPAMLSTSLILFVPWFEWSSTRILLYPLMYIFIITPFFFFGKKKTEYIISGLFFGLAFLTHPFGLYIILSYNIFLLLNREFKGILISNLIGLVIFIPWFIRNYYYFQDIGWGLYLPLTDKLSNYLSFLPTISDDVSYLPTNVVSSAKIDFDILPQPFLPFDVFGGVFNEMFSFFHVGLIVIFILVFAGFSFISFKNISRKSVKKGLIYFSVVIILYLIVWQISEVNSQFSSQGEDVLFSHSTLLTLQIFFIFIFPIILIFLFYKFSNNFLDNTSRFQKFILISSFITLIIVYLYSLNSGRLVPSHKHFLLQLLLLLPLAIIGAEKIFIVLLNRFNFDNHTLKNLIVFKNISTRNVCYLILISISVILIIDMSYGLEKINSHALTFKIENNDAKIINNFINNEIDLNATMGTNHPYLVSLKTDLSSVVLPMFFDQISFQKYIEYYDIDYLVFYSLESDIHQQVWDERKNYIFAWGISDYYYEELYSTGDSYILKVENVLDSDISRPDAYAVKAIKLEKIGDLSTSKEVLDEFKEFKSDDAEISHKICDTFLLNKKFSIAEIQCQNIIDINPDDLNANVKLFLVKLNLDEIDLKSNSEQNNPKLVISLQDSIDLNLNKEIIFENEENYLHTIAYLDSFTNSMFKNDLVLTKFYLSFEHSDYETTERTCNKINNAISNELKYFKKFNLSVNDIDIHNFLEIIDKCTISHFKTIEQDKHPDYDDYVIWHKDVSLIFLKITDMDPEIKKNPDFLELRENEFINYHLQSSETLLSIGEYREAELAINTAIDKAKFDTELWAQKGKIIESSGDFVRALDAYEFANRFSDGKYDQKVDELKEKI